MGPVAAAQLAEFEAEIPATRRVLERIPADRFSWQPHPRSMNAGQLAQHVAAIPGNIARMARMDGFDVSLAPTSYPNPDDHETLMATFDKSVASLRDVFASLDEAADQATWRLTFKDRQIATWSRLTMIRTMGLNHWYHHRGELVVYLRLLGVAVPVVYGRSADENPFAETAA